MSTFTVGRERLARRLSVLRSDLALLRAEPVSLAGQTARSCLRVADALVAPGAEASDLAVAARLYSDVLRLAREAGETDDDTVAARADSASSLGDADAPEPLHFAALPASELHPVVAHLADRARVAADRLAPRWSAALWSHPRARRLVIVALGVGVGLVVVAWLLGRRPLFAGPDLARGKSVTASSVIPGSDLAALVDGERGRYDQAGATTAPAVPGAWMMVDLGAVEPIRRIVVCNRGDRDMNDGLPLALDVSDDGTTFRPVAARQTHFGDGTLFSSPWSVNVRERARFVRVRAHGYLALSELEIY